MTPVSFIQFASAAPGKANASISRVAAMLFAIDRIDYGFCCVKISLRIDVKYTQTSQFRIVYAMPPHILKG